MSDPVNTEALRKTAHELDGSDFRVVREAGDVLEAAADEIDRLRDRAADDARDRERLRVDFNARAAEASRLLAVIGDAPHSAICDSYEDKPCTCWKSRA